MHTRIGNNVNAGGDYLSTRGKEEPGAPAFIMAAGLNYDDGHFFGSFTFHHTTSQYSTLMNDQKMPGYSEADMSIGHTLPSFGAALHPKAMVTFLNLAGNNYLSSINGFAMTAHSRKGVFGNTVNGSTPTYQIGGGFSAVATVSTDF